MEGIYRVIFFATPKPSFEGNPIWPPSEEEILLSPKLLVDIDNPGILYGDFDNGELI